MKKGDFYWSSGSYWSMPVSIEADWGDSGTYENGYKDYMAFSEGGRHPAVWYEAHMNDPATPQPYKDGLKAAKERRDSFRVVRVEGSDSE